MHKKHCISFKAGYRYKHPKLGIDDDRALHCVCVYCCVCVCVYGGITKRNFNTQKLLCNVLTTICLFCDLEISHKNNEIK